MIAGLAAAAIVLGAACLSATAGPDESNRPWQEIYRTAVANADLEDWAGCEARIREVLKDKPEPDRNVRLYGMWHTAYMPYYYLGLAQYHQGRTKEALASFEREEAAGVVQHDPVAFLKLTKIKMQITGGKAAAPPPASGASAAASVPKPAAGGKSVAGKDPIFDGLEFFFEGDYDKSIASFQEALKVSKGDDLTLHLYLGMAYAGKASMDKAQETIWRNMAILEFQRVHQIDPGYTLSSGVFSESMVQLFKDADKKP